MMAARTEIEI